ncbi:pantetheine-phosphate adenylyltransferase [Halobacteria archaeon HArc-gm2]|nr:pantetheine-phosphate adenylyltransferase [Halobacteria archaeon HArc-gm2]
MKVAVAGTFGPIHDGHRNLFEHALQYGDEGVLVAVTSQEMATSSRTREVPSLEDRTAAVREEFDALNEWGRDVEIRTLDDEHGIASTDPSIDALVTSPETAEELADINTNRRARDLEPIEGILVPYVLADDGERISSTRVVAGEIDEHGQVLGDEN